MKEIIKNRVGEMRSSHKWTQEELAVEVGVSRQTVIAIEKGNYTPSVLLALKLAKSFNVPVDKLFNIHYEK